MSEPPTSRSRVSSSLGAIGAPLVNVVEYAGGMAYLAIDTASWCVRGILSRSIRFGWAAVWMQMVRIGIRSIGIICLVSMCIGLILVLQMAPPLRDFGQVDKVANVNAVAILRELGPLISAIVLTGFAGASIAAELGTMVVGEEIEALESMALNPVRFLVVPRVLASTLSLIVLTIYADIVAIGAGGVMGVFMLDIPWSVYWANTLEQAKLADFLTGCFKGGVFGFLIGLIACFNGLRVSGGAAGVGNATTTTVVLSIVFIIGADLLFTAIFFVLGWT